MTDQKTQLIGRVIGIVISMLVDMGAGYLMGHHFHSFIIGYVTYAVLVSLDSCSIKLADVRDLLKGGR